MLSLILHLCAATRASGLARNAAAAATLSSDAAAVKRGTPGYEALLEKNWVGNVKFDSAETVVPASLEELRAAIRGARAPVRVVGRGHSFTPVAACKCGTLLSLARLNRVLDFRAPTADSPLGSITIEGGVTYTELIQHLGERGALRNLPSCPQFTVAGAIATGTHGSGLHIQNLAADVSMLEFMLPNGTTVVYDRSTPELLEGVRVHLGCLGVVTRLTLDVVPYFEVSAYRYDDVPLETAIESLPDVFQDCDSLSIWTSGFGTGPGAGLAWMTYRHFHPHWDQSHAVPQHEPPAFGTPQLAMMER